jgi:metallo-beta-lactamase class B
MKIRLGLAALLACSAASLTGSLGQPAEPPTPDSLVAAAKRAAGTDYTGTFARICVAPDNANAGRGARGPGAGRAAAGAGRAAGPRPAPDRASWYAKPYKVFDNLYWVGTKIHNSWALTTSQGIIIFDTLYDYAVDPEIVQGLTKLGLNPRDVKYVIISHAHGDHDQGAALLQSRFGAHVVMGAPDWDSTLARPATAAGGVPKKGPGDVAVGPEGYRLTLGDTTVNVVFTPGHTVGTLSATFPVKDHGRPLVVAYNGGTAFNFPRLAENFAIYEASQRKMQQAAKAAGATVLISNHSEFDYAWDRVRAAQVARDPGEPHPFETNAETVQRYFDVTADCAEAQRLSFK